MPSIKKILKDHQITTKEALINTLKGTEKENVLLLHYKVSNLDEAVNKLFSVIESIHCREIELKDEKDARVVWDTSQRSIYNMEIGGLNESKKSLEMILAKLK